MTVMLRPATAADIPALYAIAAAQNAVHEAGYFERCIAEQDAGNRIVVMAFDGDAAAGYAHLVWRPNYLPFRRMEVPEIQDLNVIPACRRNGIGEKIIDYCEGRARAEGRTDIGISVGLYASYGAAQRLYVRKGYIPDGAGVAYDEEPVRAGALHAVDDLLTLKLVKQL